MRILLTSRAALSKAGKPHNELIQYLIDFKTAGNPVAIMSNRPQPDWFEKYFGGTGVQYIYEPGRGNGDVIIRNAKKFALKSFDAIVLAANQDDVAMGRNGGALRVAAGWCNDKYISSLGISVEDVSDLQKLISLTEGWAGHWWYSHSEAFYGIRALADLSSYGKTFTQQDFAQKLTAAAKQGGVRLKALSAIVARSMLIEGLGATDRLAWGVYPSSSSDNQDNETLSDFTQRLRTTVSNVRFAKRGVPLFIRHKPSSKRSLGASGDRTNPAEQLETIHLNPFYKEGNRLSGRNVVVIDDCTTYGVSFGVAAALLRKAGAKSVLGVALGKFGNQLRYYEIDIHKDPFSPLSNGDYTVKQVSTLQNKGDGVAQHDLMALIT